MMNGIDIHTHVVPESFPAYKGSGIDVAWPSMEPAHCCHRHVIINGKNFRTVSSQCWDVDSRKSDMAKTGIERQVLSPMPELLSYWIPASDAAILSRYMNETIANMVHSDPHRFSGLATVPLQDIDLAIKELNYAINELGLEGVELGTNVNGIPIGSPQFEEFFKEVEKLDACIFVHPIRPCGMDRLVGHASLEQVLAFPCETGLAAMSMITGGVLSRYPKLRIALSHGGGSFATLVARYTHAWNIFAPIKESVPENPMELAKRFYFDSLLYNKKLLLNQIDLFGKSQTLIGTDYPFVIMEKNPIPMIDELGFHEKDKELFLRNNALRWLGRS